MKKPVTFLAAAAAELRDLPDNIEILVELG
jgi:hypothetical protein